VTRIEMLHDDDGRGECAGQRGKHFAKGTQTACRRGQGHDLERTVPDLGQVVHVVSCD
jgi:hypothetical protein